MHNDNHNMEDYDWNEGEPEFEGDMARTQLHRIHEMTEMLLDIIGENDNLPGWIQFKLDRSYNDMTDLFAYMESKSHNKFEPHFSDDGMMIDDIEAEPVEEAKKGSKGLWTNIHARRKAGKPRLKPGQKGYPKTLNIGK